jgi:YggT family protein
MARMIIIGAEKGEKNMFVLANFIRAAAAVLDIVITIYIWIIIIRALISWVNPDPYNPIVRILHAITDPVLRPFRRIIPIVGGLDLSPLVVILILVFLRMFLVPTLMQLAANLGYTGSL